MEATWQATQYLQQHTIFSTVQNVDRHSIVCRETAATYLISDAAPALYVAAKLQQPGLQTNQMLLTSIYQANTQQPYSVI